jgi:peptide/nickel transport system ATP-binding protein
MHPDELSIATPLLSVRNVRIGVGEGDDAFDIVEDLSLDVVEGETLAIVGESGCGKTTAALSLLGLNPPGMTIRGGSIRFDGNELTTMSARAYRRLRGGPMAMVFQDPMSSMNPLRKVGTQISEALRIHQPRLVRREVRERVHELLRSVGIPDPIRRAQQYPHEFSGGMRQRAMIAIAIANRPRLLVADEPTTALDVTVQAQIIELLLDAQETLGAALVLVTHDLGLVAELADRVAVMYAGRLVEVNETRTLLHEPQHPYTVGLLDSVPSLGTARREFAPIPGQAPLPQNRPSGCAFHPRCALGSDDERCRSERPELIELGSGAAACYYPGQQGARTAALATEWTRTGEKTAPLVTIRDLHVEFPLRSRVLRREAGRVRAVDGVDLTVERGEIHAVVGESGSGKTTLARAVVGLSPVTAGTIELEGLGDIAGRRRNADVPRRIQLVFQDPYASLNPRMTLGAIVGEPLRVHDVVDKAERSARVAELFELVGLSASMRSRYPHELSGGQRQRIGLARALALDPDLIILDEPVSALDVSVQAQILALLARLRRELDVAYLLIAHDLALVEQIADRVSVMYFGRIVETGTIDQVFGDPRHPYTRALIASTPSITRGLDDRLPRAAGEPPSPLDPPEGCSFRTRCPEVIDACASTDPALRPTPSGALAACIRVDELEAVPVQISASAEEGRSDVRTD